MTAQKLRKKYLDFFKSKGHAVIPSASLIPENDPSALFISAGMHPLVPYLLGEKHPLGRRLVNFQKSIRTSDIDDVGDAWHLTFFEMLGNWSLGDYFKKEAIEWSWEFLTDKKWLGLDPRRLYVTVFKGDKDAPLDEESIKIWKEQFQKADIKASVWQQKAPSRSDRIFPLSKKDNWWGLSGGTGPCGPDTEMFYDSGKASCSIDCRPGCSCGKYVEIWNDVFMQYYKGADGRCQAMKQKNVDTGMGLERTIAVLYGKDNVYETELFVPIIDKIITLSKKHSVYKEEILKADQKPIRVIADHIKAATFILGDDFGVVPSNVDQGYIVRRLIRRAVRYGRKIGIRERFTDQVAAVVIGMYKDVYPELDRNRERILNELLKEENKFKKTLEKGLREFEKTVSDNRISGKEAFDLYQTYGFPIEMTKELLEERGLSFDEKEFQKEFERHQELSRTASQGKFRGGLADLGEETIKLHTATHLLLAALRRVLGEHVFQKGSNITAKRLRLDFSHGQKLTDEEKQEVERLVNEAIEKDLPVVCNEMSFNQAKEEGAMGVFESKYGERVKVYTIGDDDEIFSKEVCGGPHVERTGVLGKFRIKKEESSSAGVRRIKAVLES